MLGLGSYGSSDDSDSDSDNEKEVKKHAPAPKKPAFALPSADAAFATTVAPKFLDKKADEPVIIPTKTKEKPKPAKAPAVVKKQAEAPVVSAAAKRAREDAEIRALQASINSKKKQKKKGSAKDRVKGQRLKGQTLGGETTRWKSDAEMVMRQQYD